MQVATLAAAIRGVHTPHRSTGIGREPREVGMAQQFMNKLNANERMALWGAVIVFIVSLIGTSWFTLILSAAVVVIYYLKYSPTSNITWPVQVELLTLVLSGIIGVLALLGLVAMLGFGGLLGGFGLGFGFFGGLFVIILIGAIANAIGAGMMVLGTWREYQAMTPATPPPPPPAA
jgi:hypothetical protein